MGENAEDERCAGLSGAAAVKGKKAVIIEKVIANIAKEPEAAVQIATKQEWAALFRWN